MVNVYIIIKHVVLMLMCVFLALLSMIKFIYFIYKFDLV